jgi:hypothetical protein
MEPSGEQATLEGGAALEGAATPEGVTGGA